MELPAVRSFRNRFHAARDELAAFLRLRAGQPGRLDVLSAPCGIPRDLVEGNRAFRASGVPARATVTFHGLDLDTTALQDAVAFTRAEGLDPFVPLHGDIFDPASYPTEMDFITSTGLAEFLDDEQMGNLFSIFFDRLRPGGVFLTSGMRGRPVSDYLLRLAELDVHYRTAADLERLARRLPFSRIDTRVDDLGLQAILIAHR